MKPALFIAALSSVFLQAQQASPPAALKFDVVSIRRHAADSGPAQIGPTPDGFRSIGLPLFAIFQFAWALPNHSGVLRGNQIDGSPGWLTTELYDVVAKVAPADLAGWHNPQIRQAQIRQAMLRTMLQAMLAERCKVVVHYADKEMPVYDLVIAKGGPKFKPAETVDTAELRRKRPAAGIMRGNGAMAEEGPEKTQFYAISMATLAGTILSSLAERPVLDKTGLAGYYDLVLPASALKPQRLSPSPLAPQPLDAPPPPPEGESIFTALPLATGLRLKPAKG